jgi:ketosteroid isomerase-like protein
MPLNPHVFDITGLSEDEIAIMQIERDMARAQNVGGVTETWDDSVTYVDFGTGRYLSKAAAYDEIARQFTAVTNLRTQVIELTVRARGDLGYAFSRQNFIADIVGADGEINWVFRETDVFEKKDGRWRLIHQHLSAPVDLTTGSAVLVSEVSSAELPPLRDAVRFHRSPRYRERRAPVIRMPSRPQERLRCPLQRTRKSCVDTSTPTRT